MKIIRGIYLIKAVAYFSFFLAFDNIKINLGGLFLGMVMLVFFAVEAIEDKIDEINKDNK